MDRQHRHDLEQGDLERFIFHFNEWRAKWGMHVMIVLLVLMASYWTFNFVRTRQIENHEATWKELALETTATGFRGIASDNQGAVAEALAYLRGGDVLLSEATFGKPDALDNPATAPAAKESRDPQALLKEAEAMYQAAINAPKADATIRLNAALGLAAIAESRQDYKQAAEIYTKVARDAAGVSAPLRQAAETRLKAIERLAAPMVFAPEPPPVAAGHDPLSSFSLPPILNPATQPAPATP